MKVGQAMPHVRVASPDQTIRELARTMVERQHRRHLARSEIEILLALGVDDPDAACGGDYRCRGRAIP
jgi:CBS domain-containing protein